MNAAFQPIDDWRKRFGLNKPAMTEEESIAFAKWLVSFQKRPWDWVLACYPWRVDGLPLKKELPQIWQRRLLMDLQAELQRDNLLPEEVANRVFRIAVAAGNGVGKTGLVAWLIHWFCSCYPRGEAVITASTSDQLSTKTWRELRKWQELAINGWQFDWTATRYKHQDMPEQWFAAAIPWSEGNPQAFAGTHERYVLIIFDEASGISRSIWDVIEGALTTGIVFFLVFGNPSETDGGFYDAFNRFAALWPMRYRVDAREVTFANRALIQSWIDTHGLDSDFVRIHVLGQFPKLSTTTFIGHEVVAQAMARTITWAEIPRIVPRLMGVDPSRGDGDPNALVKRIGRKVEKGIKTWYERDAMYSADYIAREINEWQPDLVFIDGVGLGGPIIDYLRRRGFGRVIVDVQSGATPNDPTEKKRYANMRTCMWSRMREHLPFMDLPDDPELAEELCSPKFRNELKTDRELLEPKAEMKRRGVRSPNKADALSFTYWFLVPTAAATSSGISEPGAV